MLNDTTTQLLQRLMQVGIVTAINNDDHLARVQFQNTGITSAWLKVIDNHPHIPDYDPAPQHTEEKGGGSGDPAYESHSHDLIIKQWMPHVNDTVLCIFIPTPNGDGYVLGGIK